MTRLAVAVNRRRNMRSGNCRSCGVLVAAEAGYLYRDTDTRTVRRLGHFGWFVKCAECHLGNKSKSIVAAERRKVTTKSSPRPWTVTQAKTWDVVYEIQGGEPAIRVSKGLASETISYRHLITHQFSALTDDYLETHSFWGRPLSAAAAKLLSDQILPLVAMARNLEEIAENQAVKKLVDSGAKELPCVVARAVTYLGGTYYLCGRIDGTASIHGHDSANRYFAGTVESLIGGII